MKQFIVSHFSRIAAVLTLCALCVLTLAAGKNEKAASPIDLNAYGSLMSNRITRVEDLINRHYEQQDTFALLIPPGLEFLNQPGNPDTIVIDLNSKELDATFAKALFSARPVYRNSVPTYEITLQETVQGTIEIRDNADQLLYTDPAPAGYVIPYELLFRQKQHPMLYYPELARYRLKTKLTLLPEQYVEHYLYAQARIAEAAALMQEEEGDGMMLMREGMEEEVYISGMREETNGLLLELSYLEGYSGTVWSAYSYDAQDTLSKTFMGLENVWTLISSNIVLTGETSVAWIDTRPMGFDEQINPVHRFYAFGANTDSDNDGLSDGYELFVTKTNPDDLDSDGDGLNDGWEVQNGLDPLSSEGDDGADGDPDRDGLSNLEELQLNRNPQGFDDVIALASASVGVEGRSVRVEQQKCGFVEYTVPSSPPKIYLLERKLDWDYCDVDLCAQIRLQYSNTTYLACDPQSGSITGLTTYSYTWVSTSEAIECRNETWSVDGSDFGIPMDCNDQQWDQCVITNNSIYKWRFQLSGPTGGGSLDCEGWHDGQPNRDEALMTANLESEYTTQYLISNAGATLLDWTSWSELLWGQRRSIAMPGPSSVSTNQSTLIASRNLEADEMNISLQILQFRFKVMDTTAAVYRVSWVELYHPEDTNEPTQIVGLRSTVFEGSGSQEEIYSPEFVLEPPSEDGWVEPIVIKVDLEFQNSHMSAGKLIDPLSPPRDVRVGVVQGDTVKFKAKLTPAVTLQSGDYVWTGVQSGNGPEIDITFNSTGTHSEQLQVPGCQARVGRTTVANVIGFGETAWMALHPQYWISAFELRDEALAWASNNQAALGGGLHNGRADAARHAYWNAIMTFDWNAADAEGLATAHERTGLDDGGPHNETVMDLENNADGRAIGGGGSTNRVQLQNAVIGALNAGTLTILNDLGNANEVGLLQPSNQ